MNWKTASKTLALAALFAGAGSCMPDYTFVPCGDGIHPTICIIDPVDEGTINAGPVDPDPMFDVRVVVSNFTIRMPNTCGAMPMCGHIHIVVDDINAGEDAAITCTTATAGGQDYTAPGFSAVIPIHLGACRMATGVPPRGQFRISAFLRADDHTEAPAEVFDVIRVTVM